MYWQAGSIYIVEFEEKGQYQKDEIYCFVKKGRVILINKHGKLFNPSFKYLSIDKKL